MHHYKAPSFLSNGHFQTLYPYFFRRVNLEISLTERLNLIDGDFLDLDWYKSDLQNEGLLILSHGLEGNSRQSYIQGMVDTFIDNGYDSLAWNCRGCSGQMNNLARFYHSGDSDDLAIVIEHALKNSQYKEIVLVGFSMGANITLKYLGEKGDLLSSKIKKAMAISTPVQLGDCALHLNKLSNSLYLYNFLLTMKMKLLKKNRQISLPKEMVRNGLKAMDLISWDNHVTAPMHGFENGLDYYAKSSSIHYIKDICIPTLFLSAKNDPFLPESCFIDPAFHNKLLTTCYPKQGGHVGFNCGKNRKNYWSEQKALKFVIES